MDRKDLDRALAENRLWLDVECGEIAELKEYRRGYLDALADVEARLYMQELEREQRALDILKGGSR